MNFAMCDHPVCRTLRLLILLILGSFPATSTDIRASGAAGGTPSTQEWEPYAQRPALMPMMTRDPQAEILRSSSTGDFRVNGSWRRDFPVEGGRHYNVRAEFMPQGITTSRRTVLVQVDWKDSQGSRVGYPDYPETRSESQGGWKQVSSTLQAPADASSATVDLVFRWTTAGNVTWRNVTFEATAIPASRRAAIATVFFRPSNSSGPEENLRQFGEQVERAARGGADLVCLPEGITLVGTRKTYLEVAEPVPGPSTRFLGELARRHQIYIVAGILEKEGETVFNTAILLDRKGDLKGKYRKVSLPREEFEGGITPGTELPVFDTDFGRIGILVCWDIQFPETARQLAYKGAEVILLPIWGGIEPLFPARAIENQIFLVSSSYDSRTGIWDREGKLVAEASENGSFAIGRIDLAERTIWEWLGDLRSRITREGPLVREVE